MVDRQRYRLEQRLGKGGMGDVFLATDTLLGKQVALKLIKDALFGSEELRKRFEREVAVCAALKSDHIVEVNDYAVTPEGYPFYVMEYLHGQTLGQLLRQERRLTVKRTVRIISQVCQGLRLAHEGVTLWRDGAVVSGKIKVIHRDLKPDNIFLVSTTLGELVKVLDFGIAKIRGEAEKTNLTRTFLGTFRYASPEQFGVAKDIDGRADIYSLGIILYEMLSGSDPFGFRTSGRSTTGVAWARAHASKPPVPLRSQPGLEQLSPELEAVVMRCLQKAPNERFVSVDELHRALQAAAMCEVSNSNGLRTPASKQGSIDDTVNRPLAAQPRVPNDTIFQPPLQAERGLEDDTVNRPLAAKQEVPDATIFQAPSAEQGSNDSTINRPLAAKQKIPDSTIAQNSAVPRQRVPDVTIAQNPGTPERRAPDVTITQMPEASQQASRIFLTRLLLPLSMGFAIGIAVMGGIYAYFQLQLRETSVVEEIQNLKTQGKYEDCVTKAETVGQDSSLYANAQSLLNDCQLEHAKQLAVGKDFIEAITAAKKIPENSPLCQEAQTLSNQWSKHVDNSI